jgi:hypothetical protein
MSVRYDLRLQFAPATAGPMSLGRVERALAPTNAPRS